MRRVALSMAQEMPALDAALELFGPEPGGARADTTQVVMVQRLGAGYDCAYQVSPYQLVPHQGEALPAGHQQVGHQLAPHQAAMARTTIELPARVEYGVVPIALQVRDTRGNLSLAAMTAAFVNSSPSAPVDLSLSEDDGAIVAQLTEWPDV